MRQRFARDQMTMEYVDSSLTKTQTLKYKGMHYRHGSHSTGSTEVE